MYVYIYIRNIIWQHTIEGLRLPQAVHLDLAVLEAERVVDGEVAAAGVGVRDLLHHLRASTIHVRSLQGWLRLGWLKIP